MKLTTCDCCGVEIKPQDSLDLRGELSFYKKQGTTGEPVTTWNCSISYEIDNMQQDVCRKCMVEAINQQLNSVL